MKSLIAVLALAFSSMVLLLSGCDVDPFGFDKKPLAGPYYLERFENGRYYVRKKGKDPIEDVVQGSVTEVGWNSSAILAYRISEFQGDPDGWFAIDVSSGKITGPLTKAQIAACSDLASIVPMPAEDAFKK